MKYKDDKSSLNCIIYRRFSCCCQVSLSSRGPKEIGKDSLAEYQFICKIKVITMNCNITLLCILYTLDFRAVGNFN